MLLCKVCVYIHIPYIPKLHIIHNTTLGINRNTKYVCCFLFRFSAAVRKDISNQMFYFLYVNSILKL